MNINAQISAEEHKHPWERIPGETNKAYAAFVIYYQMGADRSLSAVAKHLDKSKRQMETWSSKYGWVARAQAYDDFQAKLLFYEEIEEHKNKLRGYKKKREQLSVAAFVNAKFLLEKLNTRLEKLTDQELNEVSAENLGRMLDTAARLADISLNNLGHALSVEEIMQEMELDKRNMTG